MSFLERIFGGHHGGGHHGGGHHGGGHHGGHHDSSHGYGNGVPPGGNNGGIGCPNCRVMNAPGARFCQQCGTSLTPAACAQCGTVLQAGAKFCGQCGHARN